MANLDSLTISDSGYLGLPSGSTAYRPVSPSSGYMRFNTDFGLIEVFDGSNWREINSGNVLGGGDGSSSDNPGTSAAQIKQDTGTSTSGVYWIVKNGEPEKIYCDMVNDGGGWMLYTSFASDNPFDSTNEPAWNGNRVLYTQLSTYGYSLNYATNWHDGVNANLGSYVRRSEFFAHFYSSSPQGQFTMTSWNGPDFITELRVRHGNGSSSYTGSSGNIITNNVTHVTGSRGNYVSTDVVPFSPTGASPIFRNLETGIAGISWIFMR